LLGQIAEGRGETDVALQHYQMAADSNSEIGKDALNRAVHIDLPRNPAKYIQAAAQADNAGNLYAVVQNNTSTPIVRVRVRVVKYEAKTGRIVAQSESMQIAGSVAPGKRSQIAVGAQVNNIQEVQLYKVLVEAAELAQ
jgi:hypothetical protein